VEPIDLESLRAAVPGSTVGLDRLILVHALIILHSWSLLPTHIALALPAAALIPAAFACLDRMARHAAARPAGFPALAVTTAYAFRRGSPCTQRGRGANDVFCCVAGADSCAVWRRSRSTSLCSQWAAAAPTSLASEPVFGARGDGAAECRERTDRHPERWRSRCGTAGRYLCRLTPIAAKNARPVLFESTAAPRVACSCPSRCPPF
jgi:hypothetical protein